MDDRNMNRLLMQKAEKRFQGHDNLYSRYIPRIPASAEREYIRLVDAYMNILKETLEEELPKLKESYKKERDEEIRKNRRNDGFTDFFLALTGIFTRIKNSIISRTEGFGLRRRLENIANINRKLTVKEWKKSVKSTIGIDIREDYYLGDFYQEHLTEWVSDNVNLIKTIPENTLDKMKEIIYDGYTTGRTTTRMAEDIQNAYQIGKRRAELIARDQTAKLNGAIQKAQQTDAGIEEYIWSSCMDQRVRKSHRELNGKKFRWDDPPETDGGRHCHPAQDYNCRCVARPVFNRGNLNLPVAGEEDTGSGAKDRFGIITNNNKGNPDYYDFNGKDMELVEKELSERQNETGVCFDENGKAIFAQLGNEDSIVFTKVQQKKMKGKTVTHNHPLGTPPSPEDLYILKKNKAKEFRTCGKTGTYVLKYTEEVEKLPEFDVISSMYNELLEQKIPKYKEKVRRGTDANESLRKIGEEIWNEIYKKYGVKPNFERR